MVSGATTVSVEDAKALHDRHVPFVDVRSKKAWKWGRVPKSIHIDLIKEFSEARLEQEFPDRTQEFVVYCNGPRCLRSSLAVERAVQWGFTHVYYFREGFPAWVESDYPVVSVGNLVDASEEDNNDQLVRSSPSSNHQEDHTESR